MSQLRVLVFAPAVAAVLLLGLVPSAGATPPPDAFCVIVIEGLDDFRLVRVTVDEDTNLTQRQALWTTVDLDADGAITPEEAEAFRRGGVALWPRQEALGNRSLQLMLPDQVHPSGRPLYAATWRQVGHTFHHQNYTLPLVLTDALDLETQEVREFSFAPIENLGARILIGGSDLTGPPVRPSPPVAIEYVVVRAPAGWQITYLTGFGYDGYISRSVNAAEIDLPGFDTKRPFSIQFNRVEPASHESDGIPAPGPMALVGAIASALLLARRHSR